MGHSRGDVLKYSDSDADVEGTNGLCDAVGLPGDELEEALAAWTSGRQGGLRIR